ncbi:MAG TPA: hypothetical protein VH044_16695 [Polyangiaceae bacterium]|jgi:hypothetical protein|nr:hypothetical protein [Polyangiaceae bacterium]
MRGLHRAAWALAGHAALATGCGGTLGQEGPGKAPLADAGAGSSKASPDPSYTGDASPPSDDLEIPGSKLEAIPWDFCVDGLVAVR